MKFLKRLNDSKKQLLSIFFLNPTNQPDSELPPIQLDLNAPHNFNFSCGMIANAMEKEVWQDGKKYIDGTIVASSLFGGAFENKEINQYDALPEQNQPLQIIKLSCKIHVRILLEVVDDGVVFYLERYFPKVETIELEYSTSQVSVRREMKLLKHEKRTYQDLNESQRSQIFEFFYSGFYKVCVRKELFNTAMAVIQKHPILHKAEIMQYVIANNIDTIVAHMHKLDHLDSDHLKRSKDLLIMVFELLEDMRSQGQSHLLNIHELRWFLRLEKLHEVLINQGGGDDSIALSKPLEKLKQYLCSLPEYNYEYCSCHSRQSQKSHEQHDYILAPINEVINKLSQNNLWLDLSFLGKPGHG